MVEREKVTQEHIRFSADGLELEGVLHMPKGEGPFPAVAVCHPHPLYGGDMHNDVVLAVCSGLARASMAALRFNFRGVGRSQGSHEDGIGEREDVVGALAYLEKASGVNPNRIGLAGYSFGSKVAFPVALQSGIVKALALVSPFLADDEWEQMNGYAVPKLFLCGGEDNFISARQVKQRINGLPGTSRCEIIPGVDHFWWGYEGEIADRVTAFFEGVL